jgi:hypothetical protein
MTMVASSTTGHCLFLALLLLLSSAAYGQLSTSFYDTSCPTLQSTVRSVVSSAINSNSRMGASLLRLFFHDCFVQVRYCFAESHMHLQLCDLYNSSNQSHVYNILNFI